MLMQSKGANGVEDDSVGLGGNQCSIIDGDEAGEAEPS